MRSLTWRRTWKLNYEKAKQRLALVIMDLSEGQLKVLNIVAEKSGRSLGTSIFDTAVIRDSGPTNGTAFHFHYL